MSRQEMEAATRDKVLEIRLDRKNTVFDICKKFPRSSVLHSVEVIESLVSRIESRAGMRATEIGFTESTPTNACSG